MQLLTFFVRSCSLTLVVMLSTICFAYSKSNKIVLIIDTVEGPSNKFQVRVYPKILYGKQSDYSRTIPIDISTKVFPQVVVSLEPIIEGAFVSVPLDTGRGEIEFQNLVGYNDDTIRIQKLIINTCFPADSFYSSMDLIRAFRIASSDSLEVIQSETNCGVSMQTSCVEAYPNNLELVINGKRCYIPLNISSEITGVRKGYRHKTKERKVARRIAKGKPYEYYEYTGYMKEFAVKGEVDLIDH